MKKVLLSLFLAILATGYAKADTDVSTMTNAIYASATSAAPGKDVTLSIQMKNATAATISGFQFSLVLPSGATYKSIAVSSSRATVSNFTISAKGSSTIGVVCYSANSATFSGTSGEVAKITITVPSTAGNYTLKSTGGILTSKYGDEYNCSDVSTTLHVHNLTATAAKAATCTTAGNKAYWYCSGCGKYYSDANATTETTLAAMTIAALGHSYGSVSWTWTGYTAATAKKSCTRSGCSHSLSATATITSAVTTAATCSTTGVRTYTATATLDGATVTDKKTETIPATGHAYSAAPTSWNWANDGKSATATFKCAHCTTTENKTATITSAVKTAATCEVKGITTYTATAHSSTSSTNYTSTKDVQDIAALGHSYGSVSWTWTGYTAATAKKSCTRSGCTHSLSATATIISAVTTAATCTTTGVRTYTATATLDGVTVTDKKTETIPATGHAYSAAPTSWNWANDGKSATATFKCAHCTTTENKTATITSAVKTAATCEVNGTTTYTATANSSTSTTKYTDTKDVQDIAALGHSYGSVSWTWTGYTTATAKKSCTRSGCTHSLSATATITSAVTTAATCTTTGVRTYTATATLDGATVTDKKTEEIPATGHTYSTTPVWTWTGYSSAKATFTCSNNDDSQDVTATITNAVTTPATDTQDGVRTYTATVTFQNQNYTDKKTEAIPATGHTYNTTPVWTWTGYSSAKATFTCTNNDDSQDVTATITNAVTTEATCETAGVRTYTAKVTFQGQNYTDTKTETIAALGHNYGDVTWTWTGYTSAKAKKICSHNANHVLSADGTITSEITTAATCATTGVRTYTATAILNGSSYIDKQTETIAATGHHYGDPTWNWAADGKSASADFKCSSNDDTKNVVASVTNVVKTPATCEAKGTTTYTATVTFEGHEYSDTKDVVDINALGHDITYTYNGDGTHTANCSRCSYTFTEDHSYENGTCIKCGASEPVAEEDTDISQYSNVVYTSNATMCAGGNVTLSIKMKNSVAMTDYQFNLYAPAGFDLSTATATRTKTRKADNVSFSKSVQADGSLKVVCYTSDSEAFSGNDGEVCTVTFQIPNGYAVGDYPIYITYERLTAGGTTYNVDDRIKSTLTVESYILGDANSNGEVEVGDLSAIVGFILSTNIIPTFNEQAADANCNTEVEVGDLSTIVKMILGISNSKGMTRPNVEFDAALPETELCPGDETTLYVQMNTNNMSGFQFDLSLPEGITCTSIVPVASRIDSDYYFGYNNIGDNEYRVLSYSPSDNSIVGGTGDIVAVNVKVDDMMICGDYEYGLTNVINSEYNTPRFSNQCISQINFVTLHSK